ncbi:hypothetical protein [Fontimonas thermophila]|uniref:hypothetical protein n=1 Tax=Fontimonas thermophila TaxID=1076937 RepID=UPI00117AD383|nr:hypothetical protein [Fontimonas thermophila]
MNSGRGTRRAGTIKTQIRQDPVMFVENVDLTKIIFAVPGASMNVARAAAGAGDALAAGIHMLIHKA